MNHPLLRAFDDLNRDIRALAIVLVLFVVVLVVRVIFLLSYNEVDKVWTLLPYIAAALASLLVARVANRVVVHADIGHTNERNCDVVRTTHHLIAITQDMSQRVRYLRKLLAEGGYPALAIMRLAQSIETRYEVLLERDSYTYLPGDCVNLIMQMSGYVYGMGVMAAQVNESLKGQAVSTERTQGGIAHLDTLATEIEALLDGLFALRNAIEDDVKK